MADVIDISDLPEDQAQLIREFAAFIKARHRNTTLDISEVASPVTSGEETATLADFLRDFIGVIHSKDLTPGGADMSQSHRQQFVDILQAKHEQGRSR